MITGTALAPNPKRKRPAPPPMKPTPIDARNSALSLLGYPVPIAGLRSLVHHLPGVRRAHRPQDRDTARRGRRCPARCPRRHQGSKGKDLPRSPHRAKTLARLDTLRRAGLGMVAVVLKADVPADVVGIPAVWVYAYEPGSEKPCAAQEVA